MEGTMTSENIVKWVVTILLLIGWAVMSAAGCLPDNWEWVTIAVITAMFGLPPVVGGIKSTVKKLTRP
jgi:hypothetical protein